MANLEQAQELIANESWTPTPLLKAHAISARLGIDLWLKREDCTPVGSFKIRGGLVCMDTLRGDLSGEGVYVASAGNYGLAIALAGQRHGVKVTVIVPEGATPSKVERIKLCGSDVIERGTDFDAAKDYARKLALEAEAAFWEDGIVEEMAIGASTIATEIIEQDAAWDYVLVPLGNGSLIKGIAQAFKDKSPDTKVIGLVPSGAPSMYYAIKGDDWNVAESIGTIADGLAVRVPIASIVDELKPLLDDVWLVDESNLMAGVKTLIELEQTMVEPSAAITAVALGEHRNELAGNKVVAIMTGAHLSPTLLSALTDVDSLY